MILAVLKADVRRLNAAIAALEDLSGSASKKTKLAANRSQAPSNRKRRKALPHDLLVAKGKLLQFRRSLRRTRSKPERVEEA